jgi:hypothetical protein
MDLQKKSAYLALKYHVLHDRYLQFIYLPFVTITLKKVQKFNCQILPSSLEASRLAELPHL